MPSSVAALGPILLLLQDPDRGVFQLLRHLSSLLDPNNTLMELEENDGALADAYLISSASRWSDPTALPLEYCTHRMGYFRHHQLSVKCRGVRCLRPSAVLTPIWPASGREVCRKRGTVELYTRTVDMVPAGVALVACRRGRRITRCVCVQRQQTSEKRAHLISWSYLLVKCPGDGS